MGANAQTNVPLFTSGQVLTAAQQNTSAGTGVPVFATTVTRDAAFGGSNKALAEGQLCYIEASDVVQYYSSSAWITLGGGTGKVLQVVSANYSTVTNTTSTSFATCGLAATITPSSTSSKILIIATTPYRLSSNANTAQFTLFRGTVAGTNLGQGAGAGFGLVYNIGGEFFGTYATNYLDSPSTVAAQTYTVGFKVGAATVTLSAQRNDDTGSITLFEVTA